MGESPNALIPTCTITIESFGDLGPVKVEGMPNDPTAAMTILAQSMMAVMNHFIDLAAKGKMEEKRIIEVAPKVGLN